ncbi:dihydrolipoyllysine-residue acetyltransferase [Pseudohaliea rubra]|uniref:Acetyltransferase component of pyruvate dehydrogenase complex n=1 Tax=Pseudohaliea rubra DSM 19751 TaxID=1265313 RepID=A0A095XYB8_9GAMM|nr:dihydrolipoyllysine-residue acetyltransferase [Pseudohaliea rubra]KGE04756.1 Dihydrolipoamide acetyltransferase component of pyruvate dehydrogenase complex [Pseudohaliea rubra DSM 19751]
MAKEQVFVPDIGGAEAAEVVELLVGAGDSIEEEQGLIVLESDKASMEIPSTIAGRLVELLVKEGDQLAEGDPIAWVETAAAESGSAGGEPARREAEDGSDAGRGEDAAPAEAADSAPSGADTAPSAPSGADSAEETAPARAEDELSREVIDVPVPDIGSDDPVDLVEVAVTVGDTVEEGDSLVVLESDKASMEVPSPAAGEVVELLVEAGGTVGEGDLLLRLRRASPASAAAAGTVQAPGRESEEERAPAAGKDDRGEGAGPPAPKASEAPAAISEVGGSGAGPRETVAPTSAPAGTVAPPERDVYAGPAVRKLAREFGVELGRVSGSGPRGRILKEDLQGYVQKTLKEGPAPAAGAGVPPIPEVDFAAFGPVTVEERSKLDRLTAANMQRSWLNVPHVTHFDDADITELEGFRRSLKEEAAGRGTRLTPLPFLLKACAAALRAHPKFNASLSDGGNALTYKDYVHIGMAVDTPVGLMVPVLRDVDRKSLWELAEEVLAMAELARERKLKPADMQGGCFTVSSLGSMGGRGFTPIINTPEVAILGVGRAGVQPAWDGSSFQPRTLLPLSLSYDHRVINGGDAGRFMETLLGLLGDIRRLLL